MSDCFIPYVGVEIKKAHPEDAGWDLKSSIDTTIVPKSFATIPVNTKLKIPTGFYGQIFPRSGMASKGVVAICGVIDSSYTGEIKVTIMNQSNEWININSGDRIAQLVILPVPQFTMKEVKELPVTDRGSNGFGSTGR